MSDSLSRYSPNRMKTRTSDKKEDKKMNKNTKKPTIRSNKRIRIKKQNTLNDQSVLTLFKLMPNQSSLHYDFLLQSLYQTGLFLR